MDNRIKEYREKAMMSVRMLARAVGVRIEEIRALEEGTEPVSFDLALRIADWLQKPMATLFPSATIALSYLETKLPTLRHAFGDAEARRLLRKAGFHLDDNEGSTVELTLRGGSTVRLWMHDTVVRSLMKGLEKEPDFTFVVSETLDGISFALNYRHVQCCRVVRGAPEERDDDIPRLAQWSGRLTVYLCDRAQPMRFRVQPDTTRMPDPDAPEEAAQLNFIMFELDTGKRRNIEVADHRNARVLFAKNEIALVGIPSELLAA